MIRITRLLFLSFPHVLILAVTLPLVERGVTISWKYLIAAVFLFYFLELGYYAIRYAWFLWKRGDI